MIRYFSLILIFIYANVLSGQTLPEGFKIPSSFIFNQKNIQTYKPQPLFNVRAIPVTSSTIISNFISDIIVIGNDTIWFGTGKGLSRTIDRGITFQNYYGTSPFNEDDVSGIAIKDNWIVVSTAFSQTINEENVPTGSGIKVSSDYGSTWSSYPQPIDAPDDDTIYYGSSVIYALPVTVDEYNLSYDILITKKKGTSDSIVIWITSWAGELRKSTDYGNTFTRVLLPPDNLDSIYLNGGPYTFQYNPRDPPLGNNNHKAFCITAENDSTIYVGTANGINRSTDWGISWRKYNYSNTSGGVSGDFVVGLAIQRFYNNTIIWGATNPTGGTQESGFSYTSNGGVNWLNTLTEGAFTHGIGFQDSIIYAASDNGIWRSFFNSGQFAWSKPSIIYDETIKDQIRTNFFYSADSQGDSVWVGSGDGLARTVDSTFSPWTGKWKIFRAYQPLASTNETYAAPNPFSPDDEVVRIYFKTGKTSATVTIKIFDFGMNPVRTVLQNASRQSPDMLWTSWDGLRDDGRQVANGVYFYRIEIDNDQTVWGKILVLQ